MHIPTLIERKRDGGSLSEDEVRFLIAEFTGERMPDYQMSALAMAIYFQGMSADETASLTFAMLESGEKMIHPEGAPRIVDKHSTGGIGDKTSLVLAPLLACDDLWVPMISGRGLGITGGTLDKLESIPGFSVSVSREKALRQLEKIGVVMMGQTSDICPADKKLYALRDVTATVPSQPLIVASIMSKKLAESLDVLVLDVKFGSGAFMKTREEAASLGSAMQAVGSAMSVETKVLYHSMDEPLGRSVGNMLEVVEAIEVLEGRGPSDLREMTLDLAAEVSLADRDQLERWLDDGTARAKLDELVECQGGRTDDLSRLESVHVAPVIRDINAHESGKILKFDADTVGRASLALGAGRSRAGEPIDFSVGFDRLAKVGDVIAAGDVVARVHAASESAAEEGSKNILEGLQCES
ncbi:MAG: thymidine phosphorylase [Verrucomicrobiales bacterium]|nr:thymidine phosphorylase [Verrucomicrobiales bacterium]